MTTELSLCRNLWSGSVKARQLISLKLPSGMRPTGALLKEIAARHPLIEHLSLSPLSESITIDECKTPFEDFAYLKSLSLKLSYFSNDPAIPKSIGAILDGLCLESLELSGLDYENRMYSTEVDEDVWSRRMSVSCLRRLGWLWNSNINKPKT